jgi:hypothetical protein
MGYNILNRPTYRILGDVSWKSNGETVRYEMAENTFDPATVLLCKWFERSTLITPEGERHYNHMNPVMTAKVGKTTVRFMDDEELFSPAIRAKVCVWECPATVMAP